VPGPDLANSRPRWRVRLTLTALALASVAALAVPSAASAAPSISGTPVVGETLTCQPGVTAIGPVSYGWLRDGVAIPGAGGPTYVLTPADAGKAVACTTSVSTLLGGLLTEVSNVVNPPALPPVVIPPIVIPPIELPPVVPGPGGPVAPNSPGGGGGGGSSGGGGAPAADRTRPAVTGLVLAPRQFRPATPRWPMRRALFRFRLSEPATVRVVLERITTGYRGRIGCLPITAALRRSLQRGYRRAGASASIARRRADRLLKARRCTRYLRGGAISRRTPAGAQSLRFNGRVVGGALPPARYRATVVATDAARNASAPRRVTFTVLRG
jgi:hypothetical protein